jgi:hypothetical protein
VYRSLSAQAGDRVDSLDGLLAAHNALAGDATDLRHIGPERCQKRAQRGGRLNLPRLGRVEDWRADLAIYADQTPCVIRSFRRS